MSPQRIQTLLLKYGKQECTPEETAELEQWYASLDGQAARPFADDAAEADMREKLWQQISTARQPARRFHLPVWARVAAVALPLAVAALLFYNRGSRTAHNGTATVNATAAVITIPYGTTRKVSLPDGTTVTLNAGSELRYEPDFNQTHREVALTGEAYFDVTKDADKPFIIHTGKMDIRVLGTSFNVKAYPEDLTTEASLIRGSIEVTPTAQPGRRFVLKPNEKIVLPNQQLTNSPGAMPEELFATMQEKGYAVSNVSINPADSTVAETAWVSNRLAFMNESFKEIALQLERKFEVKVIFENEAIAALRFTATFDNENIAQTLEALQYTATAPFTFRIDQQNIYITR
ncbi:DUF4974 domain-containing protein [Chitinophaga lutea]|uniref:DUF4974 domain-containing protein n=1 Tax=Chitinophaga lutea TaxID=2488634 RepID=A0A3N4PK25_9BACT|nr:FecR domain-containing protein [Chitinophaga lutea]RPE09022.1 DUF4974 domain-containing protein [Chitinophaga lutea]